MATLVKYRLALLVLNCFCCVDCCAVVVWHCFTVSVLVLSVPGVELPLLLSVCLNLYLREAQVGLQK